MVFLVYLKIGYNDICYKFENLDNAFSFIRWIKLLAVKELSDDVRVKVTMEALSTSEFNQKINETEGE